MNKFCVSTSGAAVAPKEPRVNDSLAHRQSLIESALDAYTNFETECPTRLRDAIRHSLMTPGKRLRPMLVMLAAEACGGAVQNALPAACAVEMIHTYSLIHDDLPSMDNDDMRRGRPTCHKVFGDAIAILAGDALLALAFEVLARDINPPEVAAACCATLAQASGPSALVGGQCDDITQGIKSGSLELLESIHNRKTGALFLASLRLGGLVAGAPPEEHVALKQFGSHLGLAFQITDDLLDFEQDCNAPRGKQEKVSQKNKLTYPNLIGVAESQRQVERLVTLAIESLRPMESKARGLRALASFVSDRA